MAIEEQNPQIEDLDEIDISDVFTSKLVVYNDDHNSFEYVILCFMEILGHTDTQAEQCAIMIHSKGRAVVREGYLPILQSFCNALVKADLKTKVE